MSQLTKVKTCKNGALYKDDKGVEYVKIERVRASYPAFGTPQDQQNDDGNTTRAWGGKALLPKATHIEVKDMIKGVIQRLLTANDVKIPAERWFLKNGDDDGRPDEEKGMFTVSFSNKKNRPTVRDQRAEVMDDIQTIDDKFYGGCWVSVMVRPWYFDGKAKGQSKTLPKRISCGIVSVQFIRDDTPFGSGRVDDSDQWDAVEDDGTGDDGMGDDDGL